MFQLVLSPAKFVGNCRLERFLYMDVGQQQSQEETKRPGTVLWGGQGGALETFSCCLCFTQGQFLSLDAGFSPQCVCHVTEVPEGLSHSTCLDWQNAPYYFRQEQRVIF